MHGNADGPGLVRDGPGDRLPDPPGGVRGELVPLGVIELLHRADQPEVALLDQVQEDQAAPDVPLRDRHDQPEVRLDEPLLRPDPVGAELGELGHLGAERPAELAVAAQRFLGEQAGLYRLGQLHLVLRGEQRHAADLAKIDPDQVPGDGPPGQLGPAAPPFLSFLGRRIEYLDSLVHQQPDDGIRDISGQVAALEGGGDVRHGDGPAFPGLRHQFCYLIRRRDIRCLVRWRQSICCVASSRQDRKAHADQCAARAGRCGGLILSPYS